MRAPEAQSTGMQKPRGEILDRNAHYIDKMCVMRQNIHMEGKREDLL
jgi:hypothetical protein